MKRIIYTISVITASWFFAAFISYAQGWVPAPQNQSSNTPAPVHVGTLFQSKAGGLGLQALLVEGVAFFDARVGVGIGSASLAASLDVSNVRIRGGNPAAGYVLVSDTTGLARWEAPSFGGIEGPKGDTGPTGPQGSQGPPGPEGPPAAFCNYKGNFYSVGAQCGTQKNLPQNKTCSGTPPYEGRRRHICGSNGAWIDAEFTCAHIVNC